MELVPAEQINGQIIIEFISAILYEYNGRSVEIIVFIKLTINNLDLVICFFTLYGISRVLSESSCLSLLEAST